MATLREVKNRIRSVVSTRRERLLPTLFPVVVAIVVCLPVFNTLGAVHGGLKMSANWSKGHNESYVLQDYLASIGGGLFVRLPIVDRISIQTELQFKRQGLVRFYNPSLNSSASEATLSLNYLELPILVRYQFRVSDNAVPFILAGPYVGRYLFGKLNSAACIRASDYGGYRWFDEREYDTFVDDVQWGIVFGTGFDIQLTHGVLSLEGRIKYAMSSADVLFSRSEGSEKLLLAENHSDRSASFEVGYLLW